MDSSTGVRAQNVRCVVFEEATSADLELAVNAWLSTSGERRLLSLQYQLSGSAHSVLVTFTD